MRLIDADELMEHAWRDKLDSRELIAGMIAKAPTIKEIPTKIPINVFEQLISKEPKTGHWIRVDKTKVKCSECDITHFIAQYPMGEIKYCPNCGAKMESEEEVKVNDI